MQKKIIYTLWGLLATAIAAIILVLSAIRAGWLGYMPDIEELQSPISRYASQVLSADGHLLGTWSRQENRVFADADSISPAVFEALIATEDERFYSHSGFDVRALIRAIVKRGIMHRKSAGGGSTITQQLAKQLYSGIASSTMERLMQKPIEWVIAVELERTYTKEEILVLYLNYFDFLHNAVGIKTAADVYFSKSPKDLTYEEAAMLIGMCKNPSYYNPVRSPERCTDRRNTVLHQMVKNGMLSEAEYGELAEKPLGLRFHRVDHKMGEAPYLREYLRRRLMAEKPRRGDYAIWQNDQYYADSIAWENDPAYGWCNKNTKADGSRYDIYTDGLKIYTTIDSRMQRYAEEAMYSHVVQKLQPDFNKQRRTSANFPYTNLPAEKVQTLLHKAMRQSDRYRTMKAEGATEEEIAQAFRTRTPMTVFTYHGEVDTTMTPLDSIRYYKSFLRSGLLSLDPKTGAVKAYVGGLNFAHFQYDMAMVGRRQVGSTMKPYVYALAIEDGRTPEDLILNTQRTYHVGGGTWTPRNGSKSRYGEEVTLKWGLSQSNNWVTAELMYQTDPTGYRLRNLLWAFGVANPEIHPSLALCLGPCDITVGEMASGYTAFANKGIRCSPMLITRIEDSSGNVVAEFQPRMNEVISEQCAYDMIEMLRGVIDYGTGGRLRHRYGLTGPIAGKTGTTNSNSDGWFVGFVPRLVTACWVGGEDRDIHFYNTATGQGASTALPIWAYYMKKVFRDKRLGYSENEDFEIVHPHDRQTDDDEQNDKPEADFSGNKPGSSADENEHLFD
ncbi:MAG: transglycosylase domain-containing protein [Prevotellaceae bacterium]|nr:transglycosylase domain-containing protein [Prevotellaceae bacterium]